MGSTTRNMLYLAVTTVMFMTAALTGYFLFNSISNSLQDTFRSNQEQDRNQQTVLKVTDPYAVSGAAVLQSIYQIADLDADISVDGYLFPKNLDIDETNVSVIDPSRMYSPRYDRDPTGRLIAVQYTSK
jgi:hypothetical protein